MQLISLEWIPLFILMWWKFVKKPSYWLAAGVAVSLTLVLLCDYYYFLYSLMAAVGIVGYLWWRHEMFDLRDKVHWKPLALLSGLGLLLVAPLPLALLYANSHVQFDGSHDPLVFRTDALAPFVDGGFWRFYKLTQGYQSHIIANVFESTVYIGVSVLMLLVISLVKRKKFNRDIAFWQGLIIVFGVFSLGPRLLLYSHSLDRVPMPYALLEHIVPGLKLSGMPIRMMVMVTLGSAVIVSLVLAKVRLGEWKGRTLVGLFLVVFFFEMWPRPLPLTPATYPHYVNVLKSLPPGAVLDEAATSASLQLYNQTLDDRAMPFGYVSRQPKNLDTKEFPLFAYDQQGKFDLFCPQFKVRYLTTPANKPRNTNFPIVYRDNQAIIYDLKDSPAC